MSLLDARANRVYRVMDGIGLAGALLLTLACFAATEGGKSPWTHGAGYARNGVYCSGADIFVVETAPYAAGALLLFACLLSRHAALSAFLFAAFLLGWGAALLLYAARAAGVLLDDLWIWLLVVLVPMAGGFLLAARYPLRKEEEILGFGAFVAAASLVSQGLFAILSPDGRATAFGPGALLGMTGATAAGAMLFFERELLRLMGIESTADPRSPRRDGSRAAPSSSPAPSRSAPSVPGEAPSPAPLEPTAEAGETKRGPGRPRKHPPPDPNAPRRPRGRPRKDSTPEAPDSSAPPESAGGETPPSS